MKRTTKYINQFNPDQKSLLGTDEQQIKEYNLKKLQQLKEEARVRATEWNRQMRITMLGERK